MSKEITKKDTNTELATMDFMADVGVGFEGTDKDSFAIPFLRVLQKISPQCDEADSEFIDGAKGGMFFNSVSRALMDGKEGVTFLQCAYQRRFLRWAPRGADQGFKGELSPEEVATMRANGQAVEFEGRLYVPAEDGTINPKKCDMLSDTRSHFGLLIDEATGAYTQVLLALSSTQIKKSKLIMSMLNEVKVPGPNGLVTPPTWMTKIRLQSVIESNDQGSWFGIKPDSAGLITSQELYAAGRAFHQAIQAGEAKANYAETETQTGKF